MPIVKISKQKKRVEIGSFEIESPLVYEFFNKLPAGERDEKLLKALNIGVLALIEDRLSAFLSKTSNELGTELESLKLIFDLKQELFFKSTIKGTNAEEDIASYLSEYFTQSKVSDEVMLTGSMEGRMSKNKTGDIVCFVDGSEELRIVIECKFDKGVRLGDIRSKEIFTNKTDTAWSQLIESQANREGKVAIIVFDISGVDNSILQAVENVRYIPEVGFIAIVDYQKADFSNLTIAYMLARDIAVNSKPVNLDKNVLSILINRIIKDIGEVLEIKKLVNQNIDNNKMILLQLEKSLMLIEFTREYLTSFLENGNLTKEDLLEFYFADDVKERFKQIEKQISDI